MKISKQDLIELIKEEKKNILNEKQYYPLPPIPRGMAFPNEDGYLSFPGDDGFPVYQSYPENVYEMPKYKEFFDWLESHRPQGPPQLEPEPEEKFFDPDPQTYAAPMDELLTMVNEREFSAADRATMYNSELDFGRQEAPAPIRPGDGPGDRLMRRYQRAIYDADIAGREDAMKELKPKSYDYFKNDAAYKAYIKSYQTFANPYFDAIDDDPVDDKDPNLPLKIPSLMKIPAGAPDISMNEGEEEIEFPEQTITARSRKQRDMSRIKGTALATKIGRELKRRINKMRNNGEIDDNTWRQARRALYKDKDGTMAQKILVNAPPMPTEDDVLQGINDFLSQLKEASMNEGDYEDAPNKTAPHDRRPHVSSPQRNRPRPRSTQVVKPGGHHLRNPPLIPRVTASREFAKDSEGRPIRRVGRDYYDQEKARRKARRDSLQELVKEVAEVYLEQDDDYGRELAQAAGAHVLDSDEAAATKITKGYNRALATEREIVQILQDMILLYKGLSWRKQKPNTKLYKQLMASYELLKKGSSGGPVKPEFEL